ncbi:hypothetical protein BJX99DRAFT_227672 [Aspergillus californicus]
MNTPSETTSDSDPECYTPTHTSPPASIFDRERPLPSTRTPRMPLPICPRKGITFLIRDPLTGLVINLDDGILRLHPGQRGNGPSDTPHHGRDSHWHCVENENLWLGFRNAVSGRYIGRNDDTKGKCRFIVEAPRHDEWEWFCAREHPLGGHVLLVKVRKGFRAMKIGGDGGREVLVAGRGKDGTAWEFIEVPAKLGS